MNIFSTHKGDLLNYPGEVAYVIGTQGCNLHCEYCHNKLAIIDLKDNNGQEYDVFDDLQHSKIKHVAITGGEPMVQLKYGLRNFLQRLKKHGYKVKLDTNSTINGFNTVSNWIDYAAFDIKNEYQEYLYQNIFNCFEKRINFEIRVPCYCANSSHIIAVLEKIEALYLPYTNLETNKPRLPVIYLQGIKGDMVGKDSKEKIKLLKNFIQDYFKNKFKVELRNV